MDRLPGEPGSFREIVEADLRRGARLIVRIEDELDPQLRIATPEGDYHIALTLPAEEAGRLALLRALGTFMAWRQAIAFTWVAELAEPDALWACGIARRERHACLSRIRRRPRPWTAASFGPLEWLDGAGIDPLLVDLLPVGPRGLTPAEVSASKALFGRNGPFPAIHLPSGEVRGL